MHGADCVGLISGVGLELGYNWLIYDIPDRSRHAKGDKLLRGIEVMCGQPISEPDTADVLLFPTPGHKLAQHVALYTGRVVNTIIHSSSDTGRVDETDYTVWWQNRLIVAYRLPL
jgi:cell wall-associated NlpC family hydrolase